MTMSRLRLKSKIQYSISYDTVKKTPVSATQNNPLPCGSNMWTSTVTRRIVVQDRAIRNSGD